MIMSIFNKICLIIVVFLATASLAWAGFNYDSAHNYFLIDTGLKMQGNYILVGDALNANLKKADGTTINTAFLAATNNIIFVDINGSFNSGNRQMTKDIFSSPTIGIYSDHNFGIMPIGGAGAMNIGAGGTTQNITMNQNFIINNGLAMDAYYRQNISSLASNTIYVNQVLANSLEVLSASEILIPNGSVLKVSVASNMVSANAIKFNNQDFCVLKTWNTQANISNATIGTYTVAIAVPLTSCDPKYYVFDMDANLGKLICCQYASGALSY